MIEIERLTKSYGGLVAVDYLSLVAARGEILALLGPNGAGKSTTVRCIVGLQRPDRGTIQVDGKDAVTNAGAARRCLSYVPEVAALHDGLTPAEYLALKGRLFAMPEDKIARRTDQLLDGFGILDRKLEPIGSFSKGMTQKVTIASALLTEPSVLVLDEPLSGLDVETTLVLKEIIRGFAQDGGTVLYCSHLLDVVETLADRVAILDRGKLQALGNLAELRANAGANDSLERLFQQLTAAADPTERARAILAR